MNSIDDLSAALRSSVVDDSWGMMQGDIADAGDLFNINTALEGHITNWKDGREAAQSYIDVVDQMNTAPSLQGQYEAATRLRDMFKENVDVNGDMTDRQIEFWRNLSQSIYQMELLGAATDAVDIGRLQQGYE